MAKKEKDAAKDKDTIEYVIVSTKLRDAIGEVLVEVPYAKSAGIISVLAQLPVHKHQVKAEEKSSDDAEEKGNPAPESDQTAQDSQGE